MYPDLTGIVNCLMTYNRNSMIKPRLLRPFSGSLFLPEAFSHGQSSFIVALSYTLTWSFQLKDLEAITSGLPKADSRPP